MTSRLYSQLIDKLNKLHFLLIINRLSKSMHEQTYTVGLVMEHTVVLVMERLYNYLSYSKKYLTT